MNCIRSRSNKCPHRPGGKRELSSKLGNAARRDCKTRESESRYSRCAGCTNLIWTVSGIRGFHAFWIQLLPTASLLHPLWWLWPVNNGHRHLTHCNCPRLTWKSRGVKRKKEMTNRSDFILLCPPDAKSAYFILRYSIFTDLSLRFPSW